MAKKRRAARDSEDLLEELAELWDVDEDDVRELARKQRVSVAKLFEAAFAPAPKAPPRPVRAPKPVPVRKSIPARETRVSLEETEPVELDDDELDEYAELWGVDPADVEALAEELDMAPDEMNRDEVREYIDDLYDALVDEGWELDVSDLWDMYYGYAPGSGGKAA